MSLKELIKPIVSTKIAAYPEAFTLSQMEKLLPQDCKLRRVKYFNNIIEQDHRSIKKRLRASSGYRSFDTAERTLQGVEAVNMIRKGQVKRLDGSDAQGQAKFVESLFQITALAGSASRPSSSQINFCNGNRICTRAKLFGLKLKPASLPCSSFSP